MLSVGIVGLPNVGKSTLFNALTAGAARVSNYPFTTIDPNVGMIAVPDALRERLAAALAPQKVTPCFLRVLDIAGLVAGASRGEGLGNRFLGEIRQVDALLHVVRCFADADVAHVAGSVEPLRDVRIVESELLAADAELLERAIDKRRNEWQTDPRRFGEEKERFELFRRTLAEGTPLRALELDRAQRRELKGLGLLTGKPVLYVLNVAEEEAALDPHPLVAELRQAAFGGPESSRKVAEALALSVKLEEELMALEPGERREFLRELGMGASGRDRLVEEAFRLLDLIRFYTVVGGKLQAWEIERGTPAAAAAGKIHSDMEAGFIKAQVSAVEALLEHGSFQALHQQGLLRTEGRGYVIQDGEVVEFLFRS